MVNQFFNELWRDYVQLAPQAQVIAHYFAQQNAEVVNDHVAFRTFAGTALDLDHLEPLLLELGYQIQEQYRFEAKKLRARSYQHREPGVPKVFLSELLINELSPAAQTILKKYTDQIRSTELGPEVFYSGRAWFMPSWSDYSALLAESEYAAWLVAIGLRANHFTISINHLAQLEGVAQGDKNSVEMVLDTVKNLGFAVNTTGGEVKGSPEVMLEQGSTLADQQLFMFSDGVQHSIPTCFYEFALRYKQPNGEVFQGFVEGNADKIFDSTNSR